jgi:hypothetical protein
MNFTTPHDDAVATTDTAASQPATVRTGLRARTAYYERHVLAWYALGRWQDARAAWAAVCELRRP